MDPSKIKVVIVAGGKGSRLFPQTQNTPKPMLKINGKPVLEHILNGFIFYGFKQFIFSIGFKKDQIKDYFKNGKQFGVEISYVSEEESNLLGNAQGVALAKNKLKNTFIVTFGDVLRQLDISSMLKFHKQHKALGTINLYRKDKKTATSQVKFNKEKVITHFIEKPAISKIETKIVWESSSFFILEPELLSFFQKGVFQDFGKDIFPQMISKGVRLKSYLTNNYLIDVGTPNNLKQAEWDIENKLY